MVIHLPARILDRLQSPIALKNPEATSTLAGQQRSATRSIELLPRKALLRSSQTPARTPSVQEPSMDGVECRGLTRNFNYLARSPDGC
jgi:hypothetical protein